MQSRVRAVIDFGTPAAPAEGRALAAV